MHEFTAGLADDVADEEQSRHARSTGMRIIRPRRSSMIGSVTRSWPRSNVARARAPSNAPLMPDRPREPAITSFGEMKAHIGFSRRRELGANDEQCVAAKDHPQRLGRHARHIDHDFDRARGFEHINRWPAVGRGRRHAGHFPVEFRQKGFGIFRQIGRTGVGQIVHSAIIQGPS